MPSDFCGCVVSTVIKKSQVSTVSRSPCHSQTHDADSVVKGGIRGVGGSRNNYSGRSRVVKIEELEPGAAGQNEYE